MTTGAVPPTNIAFVMLVAIVLAGTSVTLDLIVIHSLNVPRAIVLLLDIVETPKDQVHLAPLPLNVPVASALRMVNVKHPEPPAVLREWVVKRVITAIPQPIGVNCKGDKELIVPLTQEFAWMVMFVTEILENVFLTIRLRVKLVQIQAIAPSVFIV